MRTEHLIALDTHCASADMAVIIGGGRLTKRLRLATAIPPLVEAVTSVRRLAYVTFEEGPMAEWLCSGLLPHIEPVTACEPGRNRWIANDSEKDDPLDAAELAQLHRGGYFKAVHHANMSCLQRLWPALLGDWTLETTETAQSWSRNPSAR